MALTSLYKASLLATNSAVALESFALASGDTATFTKSTRTSSAGASLKVDNSGTNATSNGKDTFYYAGAALGSGQDQIDISLDFSMTDATGSIQGAGIIIGDADDGNNFLDILTWVGTAVTAANTGVHVTSHVSGTGTDIATPAFTFPVGAGVITASISASGLMTVTNVPASPGGILEVGDLISTASGILPGTFISALGSGTGGTGTYQLSQNPSAAVSSTTMLASKMLNMTAQIRGSSGAYTLNLSVGQKNKTASSLVSGLSVPSLVMVGRRIGVRNFYSKDDQNAVVGEHLMAYQASVYASAAGLSVPTPAIAPGASAGSVTISGSAATGGTAPYSYQLQRAPQVGGTAGTFANAGSALSSPSTTDSGLTQGQVYYYRWVVTDSASTPLTGTSSATAYTVPTPGFTLATNPASLLLSQGSSLAIAATITNVGGYSGSPTLAVSGLPSGVTATVSGSTITFTAAGNATTGSSQVLVTASDGTLTQSVPVQLQVNPPTGVVYPTVSNVLNADLVTITRNGTTDQVQASVLKAYLTP